MRRLSLAILPMLWLAVPAQLCPADAGYLYGIHWWGYTPNQAIDSTPATLLDCPAYGAWDVETVLTHGSSWWQAPHFAPLYQDLYTNRNVTVITRIDYDWGQTVPSPSNPNYATWASSVLATVNTLAPYCHIWIIGNEPNLTGEGNGWPSNQITPSGYATIYRNVRNLIHSSANASPAGEHIVLIAPVSPGTASGSRWIAGTDWMNQVIDNVPIPEVDGFAIHSYGGTVTEFHTSYIALLNAIDAKGLWDRPVYMTEWNRYATPGSAAEESTAAQFCRDAFNDVRTSNQTLRRHNIICMTWFVYDSDQQASGGWNGYSIEYWRNSGNALGTSSDLFTAFQQTVDLRYPAGAAGTPGNNMNGGTPGGLNLARHAAQVTVDSYNTPGQMGDQAIDGVVSAGSKWCSGGTQPHWLALDLGGPRTVSGFIVRHAGAGGEPTYFNTKLFRLQSATSMAGPWTDEAYVDNTAQANITTRSYRVPKTLQFVRLYVTNAGIDSYARIPEFEVWGIPPAPTVTQQPVSANVCWGDTLTLTVAATGMGTVTYQWLKNGVTLSNAGHYAGVTTATLTISNASSNDGATYRCIVTNEGGSTNSNNASVGVLYNTTVTQHPVAKIVYAGESAQFSTSAYGAGTLTYRWQKDGTNIYDDVHYSGSASLTLTVSAATSAEAGQYRCVVTGTCGSTASNLAKLTVTPAADFDKDGDVDGVDFGLFAGCFNGSGNPLDAGCTQPDLNGDHSVDGIDFGLFAGCFNGSGNPPPCS